MNSEKKFDLLKKIKNAFGNMYIIPKFALSYIVTVTISVAILSAFNYLNTNHYVKEQTEELVSHTLNQLKQNIVHKIEFYNGIANLLYLNRKMQDDLFIERYNTIERAENFERIVTYLEPYTEDVMGATAFHVYVVNRTIPEQPNLISRIETIKEEDWFKLIEKDRDRNVWMFTKKYAPPGGNTSVLEPENGLRDSDYGLPYTYHLSLLRKLTHSPTSEYPANFIGLIKIDFEPKLFFDSLQVMPSNTKKWVDIVDREGRYVYEGRNRENEAFNKEVEKVLGLHLKEMFAGDSGSLQVKIQQQKYMLIYNTIDYTNWKLVHYISLDEYLNNAKNLNLITVLLLAIVMGVSVILSWIMASSITKDIRRLSGSMKRVQEGDFDVRIANTSKNEVGVLIRGFNTMAGKLKALVEEVYHNKVKEKEYELQALQAQLNPHFLYNTLASIKWLGVRHGVNDVVRISGSLAKFYKLSLSKGNSIIQIKEEVEQVKAYMDIQELRYKDRINMFYDVDTSVEDCLTLKLLVQPFIENALIHGISSAKKNITIQLRIYREEDTVVWKIIDDGVGMDKDKLESLLGTGNPNNRGYGIINVDQRIKLHFGNQYGIDLFSLLGAGTVVTVKTPFRTMDENLE